MTPRLVSLEVRQETTITHSVGGAEVSQDFREPGGLTAHLILAPDPNSQLEGVGFVHLHVEARPRILPEMTPDQTLEWLRNVLKQLL